VILFGITGGIAMGKSTAGLLLRQLGVAVVDCDDIARQAVEPGQPALAEIRQRFGPAVFLPDGRVHREQLARQVFSQASARADLEAILHPRIRAAWHCEVDRWREEGRSRGAVVIPLLFETRAETHFDAVVCVACSAAEQARRLRERGWDAVQSRQRLEAQWPVEKKIARSDYVVWSGGTLEVLAAQLLKIMGRPDAGGSTSSATSGGRA
jgi:dephospho-CoA kinase